MKTRVFYQIFCQWLQEDTSGTRTLKQYYFNVKLKYMKSNELEHLKYYSTLSQKQLPYLNIVFASFLSHLQFFWAMLEP